MKDRDAEMETIFSQLSEKNKDIVILVAKSIKITFAHIIICNLQNEKKKDITMSEVKLLPLKKKRGGLAYGEDMRTMR